jgi:AraC family transcriptional regulator of adaptative response / DNA-3-methyladenine glycosylase II
MRLINDGVVERCGVTGLAARLGYSVRHLTRVLTAELGAGPLGLARARRAHSARILIETTLLSLTDIAFAAGFSSLRQFNDTIRHVFGTTPTELRHRARSRGRPVVSTTGVIHLRLPFRAPCDVDGLLRFLSMRAIDGVEDAAEGRYARSLRLPYGTGVATLVPGAGHVAATVRLTDLRDLGSTVARLRRLLDLDADSIAVDDVLGADPALAAAIARTPGIRVPGSVDGCEILVRAVLGQQVSVTAARTLAGRLVADLGEPFAHPEGKVTAVFPTPGALAANVTTMLPGPRRRAETIRGVTEALADGRLEVHPGRDEADLREELLSYPGIGPWTANYVTMRVLGAPDVLLDTDLALRKGAASLGLPVEAAALRAHSSKWSPWRSYAGALLWTAAAPNPVTMPKRVQPSHHPRAREFPL